MWASSGISGLRWVKYVPLGITCANAKGEIRASSSSVIVSPLARSCCNDPRHLDGIPHHHRIRQQTETRRLVHDLFVIARLKRPLIGKKEAPGQLVAPLAPIELELHPARSGFILDIA